MQRLSKSVFSTVATRVPVCMGRVVVKTHAPAVSLSRFLSTPAGPSKSSEEVSGSAPRPLDALDEYIRTIDISLTPEQQEYVNKLKKKLRGGANTHRSVYKDVPREEEIIGMGNFVPKMAENPEALIDFALSHIPKRDGPRRTKHKKRMAARTKIRVENDARRKEETRLARLRKEAKQAKVREQVKAIREQAKVINETKRLRAEVQEQRRLKAQQQQN